MDRVQLAQPNQRRLFYPWFSRSLLSLFLLSFFFLSACQPGVSLFSEATPTPQALEERELVINTIAALPVDQALPPKLMQIPALDFEVRVDPMGWIVTDVNGARTTQWLVPPDAVGWHMNSVGAGGLGNTLLSGHQAVGEAVFAPLALGEIEVGQDIMLTATDDTVYIYRVRELSQPIPIVGATDADRAAADSYLRTTDKAQLILVTGWPDFSTTHRIFAVAEYQGRVN